MAGLFASDNRSHTSEIDDMHEKISDWIYTTSNSIDIFFSGSDKEIPSKKESYLDTSFDTYAESYRPLRYRFNVSLRLRLPRTERKLNLVLEDFKNTSSVDLPNSGALADTLRNNDYLLGIQYRRHESKYTRIRYGTGIRFRRYTPDPYLLLYLGKSYYFSKSWELLLSNKLRYFADYRLDNRAEASIIKVINERLRFSYRNIYRFIENDNDRNEIINTVALEQFISPKTGLCYSISIYSSGDSGSVFKLGYYYAGLRLRHYYYRHWAYYQVEGGTILREENNFKPAGRVAFKVGLVFGKE